MRAPPSRFYSTGTDRGSVASPLRPLELRIRLHSFDWGEPRVECVAVASAAQLDRPSHELVYGGRLFAGGHLATSMVESQTCPYE